MVSGAQQQMQSVLQKILGDSSREELGDYVSGLHEVQEVLEKAREQGALSGKEADMALSKWLTE